METTFACFAHKKFHHFSNIFHLMPVLFRCTALDFLFEGISFNATWCKKDIYNFVYVNYIFLNFIGSSSHENSRQIEKILVFGARLAQLVEHQRFNLRAMDWSPILGLNGILHFCILYENNFCLFLPLENVHHYSTIFQLTVA